MCNLTSLLLTKENNIEFFFLDQNLSIKLYRLIKMLDNFLNDNDPYEKTFPLFLLINLATKKEFHKTIGQFLWLNANEESNLESFFQNYQNNFNFLLSYIRIYLPYFLDMLLIYIYDVNSIYIIKKWFFTIINGLLSDASRFNTFFVKDEAFVEKILLLLRLEKDDYLKKCIIKLLKNFLKDNFSLRIFKAYLSYFYN